MLNKKPIYNHLKNCYNLHKAKSNTKNSGVQASSPGEQKMGRLVRISLILDLIIVCVPNFLPECYSSTKITLEVFKKVASDEF